MAADDVHTFPVNDLIEHVTDGGDCPCGPECNPVECADSSIAYVYKHHALDGREHSEPDHDKAACPGCSA
jgi:hypothetical protein